jgi:hypothetical protein
MEFERVFYKNNFAAGVDLLNIYMICKVTQMHCSLGVTADPVQMEEQTGAT